MSNDKVFDIFSYDFQARFLPEDNFDERGVVVLGKPEEKTKRAAGKRGAQSKKKAASPRVSSPSVASADEVDDLTDSQGTMTAVQQLRKELDEPSDTQELTRTGKATRGRKRKTEEPLSKTKEKLLKNAEILERLNNDNTTEESNAGQNERKPVIRSTRSRTARKRQELPEPLIESLRDEPDSEGLHESAANSQVSEENIDSDLQDRPKGHTEQNSSSIMSLKVRDRDTSMNFKINKLDRLEKIVSKIAEMYKVARDKVALEFDGQVLNPLLSSSELELEDGDLLDLYITTENKEKDKTPSPAIQTPAAPKANTVPSVGDDECFEISGSLIHPTPSEESEMITVNVVRAKTNQKLVVKLLPKQKIKRILSFFPCSERLQKPQLTLRSTQLDTNKPAEHYNLRNGDVITYHLG